MKKPRHREAKGLAHVPASTCYSPLTVSNRRVGNHSVPHGPSSENKKASPRALCRWCRGGLGAGTWGGPPRGWLARGHRRTGHPATSCFCVTPGLHPALPKPRPPASPHVSDLTFQVFRCHQAQRHHEGDFLREGDRRVTRPSSHSFTPQMCRAPAGLAHLTWMSSVFTSYPFSVRDPIGVPRDSQPSCPLGSPGRGSFSPPLVLMSMAAEEGRSVFGGVPWGLSGVSH